MKLVANLGLVLLLSPATCLAAIDRSFDPDPTLTLRPENVTDLAYWLYGWVGSYYNGTTTFHFSPLRSDDKTEDDDEPRGDVCEAFANKTASFSFDSLVSINRPDPEHEGSNPVMFSLKSWLPGADLPTGPMYNPSYNPSSGGTWELTLDESRKQANSMDTRFSFSGKPRRRPPSYLDIFIAGLQLNMSTCDNPFQDTWWGASFLTLNDTQRDGSRPGLVDPTFRVIFDNSSASFLYEGYYQANTDPGNDVLDNGDPRTYRLFGKVRVEFLGTIDAARSDILVGTRDEKPAWVPVIGFANGTGTIDAGAGSLGVRSKSLDRLTVLIVGLASGVWWYL
ncbi:hypothetical protein QBC37DRAFT_455200 [Rhypophila decipiens]|uniref:Uncharacterized protein n=1 Tax=Rhypophila decipiens TaxID=261697 RepID=A0AAN7BAV6_9PEZI|nr:hypothetical protein QBC37DRAFT_455200 [Rhypophila decipiens]